MFFITNDYILGTYNYSFLNNGINGNTIILSIFISFIDIINTIYS